MHAKDAFSQKVWKFDIFLTKKEKKDALRAKIIYWIWPNLQIIFQSLSKEKLKHPPQCLSASSVFTNFDRSINIHIKDIVILELVPENYLFLKCLRLIYMGSICSKEPALMIKNGTLQREQSILLCLNIHVQNTEFRLQFLRFTVWILVPVSEK